MTLYVKGSDVFDDVDDDDHYEDPIFKVVKTLHQYRLYCQCPSRECPSRYGKKASTGDFGTCQTNILDFNSKTTTTKLTCRCSWLSCATDPEPCPFTSHFSYPRYFPTNQQHH
jgi:hypothetical protein